jgi:hypothetical protein
MIQPITLTVLADALTEYKLVGESTNFTGYIPRTGETIQVGKTTYRVNSVNNIYRQDFHQVSAVELFVSIEL